jgi:hypothetical protein
MWKKLKIFNILLFNFKGTVHKILVSFFTYMDRPRPEKETTGFKICQNFVKSGLGRSIYVKNETKILWTVPLKISFYNFLAHLGSVRAWIRIRISIFSIRIRNTAYRFSMLFWRMHPYNIVYSEWYYFLRNVLRYVCVHLEKRLARNQWLFGYSFKTKLLSP